MAVFEAMEWSDDLGIPPAGEFTEVGACRHLG